MLPNPIPPDDWSPEQALAVYELLDQLRDCVWDRYHEQLISQFQAECEAEPCDDAQLELPLFPFNDAIPF